MQWRPFILFNSFVKWELLHRTHITCINLRIWTGTCLLSNEMERIPTKVSRNGNGNGFEFTVGIVLTRQEFNNLSKMNFVANRRTSQRGTRIPINWIIACNSRRATLCVCDALYWGDELPKDSQWAMQELLTSRDDFFKNLS